MCRAYSEIKCMHGFPREHGCGKFSLFGQLPSIQLIPVFNSLSGSMDSGAVNSSKPRYDFSQISDVEKYCLERLEEIECINCFAHTPSSIGCIAAFIGFLSRLTESNNARAGDGHGVGGDQCWFCQFVSKYMKPKYDGHENLLYGTLRCGILHAMSFHDTIDEFQRAHQAAYPTKSDCRSWLLSDNAALQQFQAESNKLLINHLTCSTKVSSLRVDTASGKYCISAFELCHDVRTALKSVFSTAKTDPDLKKQILDFVRIQVPITAI